MPVSTVPFIKHEGHIITESHGTRALIDTGSPFTWGNGKVIEAAGGFWKPRKYGAKKVQEISNYVGMEIDALVGNDLLAKGGEIGFHWSESVVTAGSNPDRWEPGIPFDLMTSAPCINVQIDFERCHALIDTGAKTSYIDPMFVIGLEPIAFQDDFHLSFGDFCTPMYRVPVAIGEEDFFGTFGVLPPELNRGLLRMSKTQAIIGTDLFKQWDTIRFDYKHHKMHLDA